MRKKTKGRLRKFEERERNIEEAAGTYKEKRTERSPRKKQRINKSRMAMSLIVMILIIVLGVSIKNIFVLQAEKKALTEEKEALLLEKESLQDELESVSDTEYIEEQARIQLKLIRPGEILYILDDEKKDKEDEKEN